MTTDRQRIRAIVLRAALFTLLAVGATFLLDDYRNFQLALIAATFCATAGLTLLVGLSGQLSLGHAVLMAAGGFGYAVVASLADDAGLPGPVRFALGIAGALVAAGIVGGLLGLAGARLKGPYLAGLTLALVIALPAIASEVPALGGGQGVGVPFEGVPDTLRGVVGVEQWHAWIAVVVAAVAVTPLALMRSGRSGTRMRAVHGDETAARLAGISPARVKTGAFVAGALAAGLGGAVMAVVTQNVSHGAYDLAFSLLLLVAVVVGGLGSIGGAAVGAVLVVLLPWLIDLVVAGVGLPSDLEQRLAGNAAVLVFGVLLIAVTVVWPGGLSHALGGRIRSLIPRLRPTRPAPHTITER
jgi:branched-chain amino acid transport system permease protein